MWTITLRDLQYRRRQFGIAVVGATLVFALTLVLTGISSGFRHEARVTVSAIDADAWVVPLGVTGPFTSQSTIPARVARQVRREPGVRDAQPLAEFGHVASLPGGDTENVNVIGHGIGRLGDPAWGRGAAPPRPGQAIVDERLGVEEGERITIASKRLRVVDVVRDRSFFAGVPIVYVGLRDAQAIAFEGRDVATTVVTRGFPRRVPRGFVALTSDAVREDMLEPLDGAIISIDILRLLMWIVAAVIIGAVTYMSALERIRDFAVLKAVGGSSRSLALSLAAQAVLASLLAAVLGAGVAQLLRPAFPMPVTIGAGAYLALAGVAIAVGVLSSLAALRRVVRVDPALAFAG
jgi:putative ABC transport system permease protein